MKIIEFKDDEQDFIGRYPACKVVGSELYKIYDWLFNRYGSDGYKFAIAFDLTNGEYTAPENPKDFCINVYFMDELFDEVVYYCGVDWCEDSIKRIKDKMK